MAPTPARSRSVGLIDIASVRLRDASISRQRRHSFSRHFRQVECECHHRSCRKGRPTSALTGAHRRGSPGHILFDGVDESIFPRHLQPHFRLGPRELRHPPTLRCVRAQQVALVHKRPRIRSLPEAIALVVSYEPVSSAPARSTSVRPSSVCLRPRRRRSTSGRPSAASSPSTRRDSAAFERRTEQ